MEKPVIGYKIISSHTYVYDVTSFNRRLVDIIIIVVIILMYVHIFYNKYVTLFFVYRSTNIWICLSTEQCSEFSLRRYP